MALASTNMPGPLPNVACCDGDLASLNMCACGVEERALRAWAEERCPKRMTDVQRAWCLNEIAQVEGWTIKEFLDASDANLARGVLAAWIDYCRDKGLIQ